MSANDKWLSWQERTTAWEEHGKRMRLTARFGLRRMGGQDPYFSVTADLDQQGKERGLWEEVGGGCMHEEIEHRLPELVPLIRWHLVSMTTGPMHYYENGKYWWERHIMHTPTDPYQHKGHLDCFKSTVVFGVLPGEDDALLEHLATPERFREWMIGRLPLVMERFRADMQTFKLLPPTSEVAA